MDQSSQREEERSLHEVEEMVIGYVVDTNKEEDEEEEETPTAAAAAVEAPSSAEASVDPPPTEEEPELTESVAADSVAADKEETPVSKAGEEQIHDIKGSEIAAATTEVDPAPDHARLLGHHATLWNCCGLLDAFKGA